MSKPKNIAPFRIQGRRTAGPRQGAASRAAGLDRIADALHTLARDFNDLTDNHDAGLGIYDAAQACRELADAYEKQTVA
jgi:hypothetical protein